MKICQYVFVWIVERRTCDTQISLELCIRRKVSSGLIINSMTTVALDPCVR